MRQYAEKAFRAIVMRWFSSAVISLHLIKREIFLNELNTMPDSHSGQCILLGKIWVFLYRFD